MITHIPKSRPPRWREQRATAHWLLVPFFAFDWIWDWVAYFLSNWKLLEVLEYLGSFSVLVAVILYFSESGDRIKQRHYQAWQVINTAQGKGGSGGRIEALQELNKDRVSLLGVDVSGAYLSSVRLERANLERSNFSAADLRKCDFRAADFNNADLHAANFRECNLQKVSFEWADMENVDLGSADLGGADLTGANLGGADLRLADLRGVRWQQVKSMRRANIFGVMNAPEGFVAWAMEHGALESEADSQ